MKKILIFSFLLGITSLGYSDTGSSSSEATMNITATVIKPLTIKSDGPLNFGILVAGNLNTARSTFSIEGDKNSSVKISFEGLTSNGATFTTPIYLTKNETVKDSLAINFNCTATDNSGIYITTNNNRILLDSNGKSKLNIAASVSTKPNQSAGEYSGQIKMKALYD
ncbi:MAG: hypothetical protein ACRC5W_10100 [Cetobacterium sp.]|uniref:hypothetical protein n=1 Tax=Cetobacterium sp. TaxID=2071632 RepID=UPI003F308F17